MRLFDLHPPPFRLRLLVVFFSCFVTGVTFFVCMLIMRPARFHYPQSSSPVATPGSTVLRKVVGQRCGRLVGCALFQSPLLCMCLFVIVWVSPSSFGWRDTRFDCWGVYGLAFLEHRMLRVWFCWVSCMCLLGVTLVVFWWFTFPRWGGWWLSRSRRGSFRCAWDVGSACVIAKVEMALSSLVLGRVLSPLCSFACTTVSLSLCIFGCPCDVVRVSNTCVQSLAPSSHRGARCFKNWSAYLRGWHWFRNCLA